MIRTVIAALVFLFIMPAVDVYSQDESAGITKTALDYMEGWYQGDAKRMKASLHKKLAKRSLQPGHGNKRQLRLTSASDMITYTQQAYGQGLWREGMQIDVIILDRFKDIASVKVVTPHYHEYLHMARMGDAWVIVNALYEKNN
jgi:hypothetical protein